MILGSVWWFTKLRGSDEVSEMRESGQEVQNLKYYSKALGLSTKLYIWKIINL